MRHLVLIFLGFLFGAIFPVAFILIDLQELGEQISARNIWWVLKSQNLLIISAISLPLTFALTAALIAEVFNKNKQLKVLNEEKEEERRKSEMNSRLAMIGELVSGVAHEINNPLMIIKGFAQNLMLKESKNLSSKGIEKLEKMDNAINRAAKIIQGLKKFSYGGKEEEFELRSAQSIVIEVLDLIEESLSKRGVNIIKDFTDDGKVKCKSLEISQVVLNLINNAVQEVEGSEEAWLKIKTFNDENSSYIIVTDSGKGISSEVHEKIFQPFFTTKVVGKGTGLGLSICKGIMEAHGGDLYYDNNYKENTRFVIVQKRVA